LDAFYSCKNTRAEQALAAAVGVKSDLLTADELDALAANAWKID
jgi:hypothetical protein